MIYPLALLDRAEEAEGFEVVEVEEVVVREAVVGAVAAVREERVVEGEEEEEVEGEVEIKVLEDIRMLRGRGGMIRRCPEWALSKPSISGVIPSSPGPSYHQTDMHTAITSSPTLPIEIIYMQMRTSPRVYVFIYTTKTRLIWFSPSIPLC